MKFTLFLAFRHLGNPKRSVVASLTALIAIVAINVSVFALTLILSVMNGVEGELAGLIHDGEAHIELLPSSATGIERVAPALAAIEGVAGSAGAAPFVRSEVLLVNRALDGNNYLETATLTGVDPEREKQVTSTLSLSWPDFAGFTYSASASQRDGIESEEGLLLGVALAEQLRIGIGERLLVVVPDASSARASSLDSLRGRQVWRRIVGLFDAGLYEFNATRAFGELNATADFLRVAGEAQGISVRGGEASRAPALADELLALPLFAGYSAETWQSKNQVLFEAIAREKVLMYLFLLLTVAIAALGIIGPLTLMISERRAEIGILRTLGMRWRAVMNLFVLEGWLMGLIGVVTGLINAWCLGWLLQRHPLPTPGDLFVLETVPILLNPIDFIWVGSITLAVRLLATLYPSWEAARMQPIEAIRAS